MTAPDWTKFTARRPFLTPGARRGPMEPATHLGKSPIPAMLVVVRGGIGRMSVKMATWGGDHVGQASKLQSAVRWLSSSAPLKVRLDRAIASLEGMLPHK